MKKIVFDLDNVLLFLNENWVNYYQEFIDAHDLKITPEELYSAIGEFEKNNNNIVITNDYFCKWLSDKLQINFCWFVKHMSHFIDKYSI